MPLYGASAPVGLYPGDPAPVLLFASTDTLVAGSTSIAVTLPPAPWGSGAQAQLMVSTSFATAPTAVVDVQTAIVDSDGNYVNAGSTSTNKQVDLLSVTTNAPFLRIKLTSQSAGGALTVKVYRMA